MAGILDIFESGRSGLQAHQRRLAVTSNNIGNVNTKGYSRQDAILESVRARHTEGPGGVRVSEVRRTVDQFVEAQLTATTQDLGRFEARQDRLQQVESVFAETDTIGLAHGIERFFNAMRDFSTFPEGLSQRTLVLSEANALASDLNQAQATLTNTRRDIDGVIGRDLATVNDLAAQIASLNEQIQIAETVGGTANELRDRRTVLVTDMAELIGIETREMPDGIAINVGGQLLVGGSQSSTLVQVPDLDQPGLNDIAFKRRDGSTLVITQQIANGRVQGQLTVRDTDLVQYQNRLDQVAATLINEVNQQHQAGFGLSGATGNRLFSALTPTVTAANANTGTTLSSISIATPTALTMDTYQLTFDTPATTFDVVNVDTGATVLNNQAYVSGTPVTFDGLSVTLTDNPGGPAPGDVFTLSAHKDAAKAIAVTLTDPNELAASATLAGIPGDNQNALALVGIGTSQQVVLDNFTLSDFHAGTAANVGKDIEQARSLKESKQSEVDQIQALREGISGVSLDEELTHLLSSQRAYEASARLVTLADELFQTVLVLGQ